MSKIRLRELIKKIIKTCICLLVGLLVIGILNILFLKTPDKFIKGYIGIGSIIVISGVVLAGILYTYFYIKNQIAREKTDTYEREVPKEIPPAIASLLLDFFADDEQDYISTISSLITKEYIEIIDDKNVKIKNQKTHNLLKHEKYAYDIITKKRHYNANIFKERLIQDAKELELIKKVNRHEKITQNIVTIIECVILMILALVLTQKGIKEELIPGIMIIEIILGILFVRSVYLIHAYKTPKKQDTLKYIYEKTTKGKEYAIKIEGLRRFFEEYTLMNQNELESIEIFGDYIPYAIALGEADAIEKFIEKNSNYRKLIYR